MKKTLLIGKLNEVTKQINEALSPYCRVQLCADDADIVGGMIRMLNPDLIIFSLVGVRGTNTAVFSLLSRESPKIPLIVVGSKVDEDELRVGGYLNNENLEFLRRPIKLEDIVARLRKSLRLDEDEGLQKILLVDDDAATLRMVQSMLAERYKVSFVTSGGKAIAACAKSRPDLILLDYDMPVCNGKQTFQMLRSEEETSDIPVIFLTGISDMNHVQGILALHPEGYLLKPPAQEKLLSKVESVLASRKAGKKG